MNVEIMSIQGICSYRHQNCVSQLTTTCLSISSMLIPIFVAIFHAAFFLHLAQEDDILILNPVYKALISWVILPNKGNSRQ